MGSNSSVKELLECPICMTYMYPPIHQCCNGHTICCKCKDRVDNICPICREELGNIRCLALEKLTELVDLPCKFHDLGCQFKFSSQNRLSHEDNCHFRPYSCPFSMDECTVTTGDIRSLVVHLKETHQVVVADVDDSIFMCKYWIVCPDLILNSKWQLAILNFFGSKFLLHLETFNMDNAPVLMASLRYMGDEGKSRNYRCSLEIGKNERVMGWQGIPRSIRDSDTSIRDNLDGLVIHQKNLKLFFIGNIIRVTGRIWKKGTVDMD